jgi:hypothetical protein
MSPSGTDTRLQLILEVAVGKNRKKRSDRPNRGRLRSGSSEPRQGVTTSKKIAGAVALALLGGAAGTYCTYVVSGRQEVRAQRATQADELAHDRTVAPFRVEGFNDGSVEYSISSAHVLDIAGSPVDPEHPDGMKERGLAPRDSRRDARGAHFSL